MAESALVVPVEVEALVVNDAIMRRDAFRWWHYNYLAMRQYRSPEPDAGSSDIGARVAGIYLGWTLPRALRHGVQDPATGAVTYPLVPNRWLVLRLSGSRPRVATGWVIESDCPFSSHVSQLDVQRTSMYLPDPATIRAWKASPDPYRSAITLDPQATEPQVANLGIPFPLAQGWSERAPAPMFLTAVAPGNPAFSAYVPHNFGVFTFVDDLHGLTPPGPQPLSYLVAGWYSDPSGDIMASWPHDTTSADPYQALLDQLGWNVTEALPQARATRSYYTGSALTVGWDPLQAPATDPLIQIRDSGKLDVALGNTAEDAFIALVSGRLAAAGHPVSTLAQLRSFLYGVLPLANQPGGDAILKRAMAAHWFGSHQSGYRWAVTAAGDSDATQAPAAAPGPPGWLDQLNSDQRQLDQAVARLKAGQWDLNAMWWKRGRYPTDSFPDPPPGVDSIDELDAQLDPAQADSLAARFLAQLRAVQAGSQTVPQPIATGAATPQEAFERGIAAFSTAHGLPAGEVLKAVPADPYFTPVDPVIMLSGVEASQEAGSGPGLRVRPGTQLVTMLSVGGHPINAAAAHGVLAGPPGFTGPPLVAGGIFTEFLLIDPGGAPALAAATGLPPDAVQAAMETHDPADYTGVLPSAGLSGWAQPWRPLFIEWQVKYTDVPETATARPWLFDGTDYRCGPGATAGISRTIGGISILGPHAPMVFRARLAEFVAQYGSDDDLSHLDEWIAQMDGWQFLSQELTGLNLLLAARDQRPFRRPLLNETIGTTPAYPLADILGYPGAGGGTPLSTEDRYRGAVTSVPYLPAGSDVPFFGIRQGQIVFEQLILYDRFGRVLPVILPGSVSGIYDADNFPLIVDAPLHPDVKLDPRVAAPAQLPPRLLQPTRLDFPLLDAATGFDSDLMAAADPIGGWILANHLDHSLLLYAGDGSALGEIRVIVTSAGAKATSWFPPPHSSVTTIADVARLAPLVANLVGAAMLASVTGFGAFLEVIDSTLWTTDPLGNRTDRSLSVLIGRPLALVRARVSLELDGPPITDSGWAATLKPPVPAFLSQAFAVRLGDQAARDDGLIGYFATGNYAVFNSVAAPVTDPAGAAAAGVRQIGTPLADGSANYLWRRPGNPEDATAEIVMVLDPRGSVHATTGILPTRTVRVRPDLVSAALTSLEVSFQVGAALTTIRPTATQAGQEPPYPQSVALPPPAESHGAWSWWQSGATAWTGYAVVDPGSGAVLRPTPNLLVDGVLQLVIDASGGRQARLPSPPSAASDPPGRGAAE